MLDAYHHIDEVEALNGRVIACTHKSHPEFSVATELWSTLHFVFVQTARRNQHSRGYGFRRSLISFLDFVAAYNKSQPENFRLTKFVDITGDVFSAFHRYLLKNKHPSSYAGIFKSGLDAIARDTGLIPSLALPRKPEPRGKKIEPIDETTFNQLTAALKQHVDELRHKIAFRKLVDEAAPYDLQELMDVVRPGRTRENLFRWYQHRLTKRSKTTAKDVVAQCSQSSDPELQALVHDPDCLSKFRELFRREWRGTPEDAPNNPFRQGVRGWNPDLPRVIKTFLMHGYPLSISLDVLAAEYNAAVIFSLERQCDTVVKLLIHRFVHARNYSLDKFPLPDMDGLMALYFPTMIDMAALVLFLMLQSGWNKETVAALDANSFEHELSGLLDSSEALIFSEKHRSQGSDKPYHDPKQFIAYSSKNNPYSIYNLIHLAKELSSPLAKQPFDYVPAWHSDGELNPLFLCLRYWADWVNKGGRHTSITNDKAFITGVRHFFERYPVHEGSRRLRRPGDIAGRLRPTWIRFHRKNNPLSLMTLIQGHQHRNTTDVYYDSSGAAMRDRKTKLRSELEAVIALLRARQFSGLLGKRANEDASVALKVFTLPGKKKSLWGCANQRNPTWPGAQQVVKSGQKCTYVHKCLLCSQIRVFEDSLPFLMERLAHIQESDRDNEGGDSFAGSASQDERRIIEFILDNWEDEDALKDAAVYQRQNRPLLPRDFASLSVLFEE
jgi:hypothetical protein